MSNRTHSNAKNNIYSRICGSQSCFVLVLQDGAHFNGLYKITRRTYFVCGWSGRRNVLSFVEILVLIQCLFNFLFLFSSKIPLKNPLFCPILQLKQSTPSTRFSHCFTHSACQEPLCFRIQAATQIPMCPIHAHSQPISRMPIARLTTSQSGNPAYICSIVDDSYTKQSVLTFPQYTSDDRGTRKGYIYEFDEARTTTHFAGALPEKLLAHQSLQFRRTHTIIHVPTHSRTTFLGLCFYSILLALLLFIYPRTSVALQSRSRHESASLGDATRATLMPSLYTARCLCRR